MHVLHAQTSVHCTASSNAHIVHTCFTHRCKPYPTHAQVSVGTCSSKFYLASGCIILDVTGTWYKDGTTLRPHGNPLYKVSSSGELRIPELTNETAGYYVCVTRIGADNLGSFRTVDINIVLQIPSELSWDSMVQICIICAL